MASIHLPTPPITKFSAFSKKHAISPASVWTLSYAIVLHRFLDVTSHFQAQEAKPHLLNGTHGAESQDGGLLVEFDPDRARESRVLISLQGLADESIRDTSSSSPFRLRPVQRSHVFHSSPEAAFSWQLCDEDSFLQESSVSTGTKNDLSIRVRGTKSSVQALLLYNPEVHSEFLVSNLGRTFCHAVSWFLDNPHQVISGLDLASEQDLRLIGGWNNEAPRPEEMCLHHVVERTVQTYPDKPAIISSHDGDAITYRQLNSLAEQLADHLITVYGLGPGKKAPLCFDKSAWAIISMLAVLKTGAAYCCLDPAHPKARHEFIITSVNATVIITSPARSSLFTDLPSVLALDADFFASKQRAENLNSSSSGPGAAAATTIRPRASPSDTCLISFTSGSTGVPKGIVHTHRTMCTGLMESAPRQLLDRVGTRVFQWAAYTFDVSLTEIYVPLLHGGCICIPSEEERLNDVAGAMERMRCEWAFFTPSFSRFFRRFPVPTALRTISMGGEAVMADDVEAWSGKGVTVLQAYGPAECITWFLKDLTAATPGSEATAPSGVATTTTTSFGRPSNVHGWIVDPDDAHRLAPVGSVGELLIEGPALLVEYLNESARTAASFVDPPPAWRATLVEVGGAAPCTNRIYRSGDLVRYLADGEMAYVGRKDAMVKLRGQRIDLGEIESVLRVSLAERYRDLDETVEVAVDLVIPSGKNRDQTLVAFLRLPTRKGEHDHRVKEDGPADDMLSGLIPSLMARLRDKLPEFMVPRAYYPVESFPYNASGKLDRRVLRHSASFLTMEELLRFSHGKGMNGSAPLTNGTSSFTQMEYAVRGQWAEALSLEPSKIKLEDNFFALGGSSLAALRLVASARDRRISILYTDIFTTQSLRELASKAARMDDGNNPNAEALTTIEPFSLLPSEARDRIVADATSQCHVPASEIEDIYPLTPQQEGLWALSLANGSSYVAHFPIRLRGGVDAARLRAAWDAVAASRRAAFMRTRFVQSCTGAYQVVLRGAAPWRIEPRGKAEEYIEADLREPLDFGESITRYALIGEGEDSVIIWTSHHALYDGYSIPLFLNAVAKRYHGGEGGESLGPEVPFSRFIAHIQQGKLAEAAASSREYWSSRYGTRDGERQRATNFPKIPHPTYRPTPTGVYTRRIPFRQPPGSRITDANVLRAALALTLAQMTGSTVVNHLEAIDGRSTAATAGVEATMGPTFATVPRRTAIDGALTAAAFLARTQDASTELIRGLHSQLGLQTIRLLSAGCAAACEFQTILVTEPEYERGYLDVFEFDERGGGIHRFNSDCVMWKCNIDTSGVDLIASFDEHTISARELRRMVNSFEENVYFLCEEDRAALISTVFEDFAVHAPAVVPSGMMHRMTNGASTQQKGGSSIGEAVINGAGLDRAVLEPLRKAWIDTLALDAANFNLEDDFFFQGGNSIRAMELVAAARTNGVSLSVATIFQKPNFSDLAKAVTLLPARQTAQGPSESSPTERGQGDATSPFSLLGADEMKDAIVADAVSQCGLAVSDIEDIFPATPLQAEFMASSQLKTGAWLAQTRYPLPSGVSIEAFRQNFERLHSSYRVLRTRIIHSAGLGGAFQVVAKATRPPVWVTSTNLAHYLETDRKSPTRYGDPLVRYAIITPYDGDSDGSQQEQAQQEKPRVVLTIHHSLYDGVTLQKLHSALTALLNGGSPEAAPSFAPFIRHLLLSPERQQASDSFWRSTLEGYQQDPRSQFPPSVTAAEGYIPSAGATLRFEISMPPARPHGITVATLVLASWSLVLSGGDSSSIATTNSGGLDGVFGARLSGRGAPVEGILDVLEPTIAHVPVRIRTERDHTVEAFLRDVQSRQAAILPFEQAGLAHIAGLSASCREACRFRTMVVVQPEGYSRAGGGGGVGEREGLLVLEAEEGFEDYRFFNDHALLLDFYPLAAGGGGKAVAVFSHDEVVMGRGEVEGIARRLEGIMGALAGAGQGVNVGMVLESVTGLL